MDGSLLDNGHWQFEDYRQRMTRKEWQKVLLEHKDTVVFRGLVRDLIATHLGVGVYEVFKRPLNEGNTDV